jgi:alanine racemase
MVLAFAYSRRYNTPSVVKVSTRRCRERAWVEINLANLRTNARTVQTAAGGAGLLPMIKANAYGLGAVKAAEALEPLDPWGYGVATPPEAIELREAGIRRPLVVFTPAASEQQELYRTYDLRAVLDDPALADCWELPFHLEIDTGMGRCGVRYDDDRLASLSSPNLEGAFTHLFAADDSPDTVPGQLTRLEQALGRLGCEPRLVHAQNSAGSWRLDRVFDIVRPGIFLYGGGCGADLPEPEVVAQVRARVASLRMLPEGESVSYGGEWRAPRETIVATLGIGYADGVRRAVQGRAEVLIGGRRYPVVGRITMDFVMVDLEGNEDSVGIGDVATMVGKDGSGEITVDEFAGWAGTISYEVLTGLGARLHREYTE